MKKNKWLLVLLVFLGAATAYTIMNRSKSTLRTELRDFAVKDTAAITKIFLVNRNGNSVTLDRKKGGGWILNKTLEPKNDQVKFLLDCFARVEVRSPVAKAAYNNVLKSLASGAIKCEIYMHGDSVPAKIWYVGGQTEDDLGTFMMLENSSMPFITYVPGFNGYLTPRFSVIADDWKSNIMFNYATGHITSVMVNYANAPERSFLIYKDDKKTYVMNPNTNKYVVQTDSTSIENYIFQYQNMYYESVVKKSQRDTLNLEASTVRISIKDIDHKLKELQIFPYPLTQRSIAQTDTLGNVLKYDLDRVYGLLTPENLLVTIQQHQLNRLLRQLSDFDAVKHPAVKRK